jgi:hypothetical protein
VTANRPAPSDYLAHAEPTKRTYEMLCFYFLGVVELDELTEHIANLKKQD